MPTALGNVRVRQSGKHVLVLTSSQFDPSRPSDIDLLRAQCRPFRIVGSIGSSFAENASGRMYSINYVRNSSGRSSGIKWSPPLNSTNSFRGALTCSKYAQAYCENRQDGNRKHNRL